MALLKLLYQCIFGALVGVLRGKVNVSEDFQCRWYHRLAIRVLQAGPIPQHLAIIMDGNRRYAKRSNLSKSKGHFIGYQRLIDCLHWCQYIGIRELTVYSFSIENFKRSQDEVDTLMNLALEKMNKMLKNIDHYLKMGICLRFVGNTDLLSEVMQEKIAQLMALTKDQRKFNLNIAIAYTSREEIVSSLRTVAGGVLDGSVTPKDITEDLMTNTLYTRGRPNPDLLLRTGGDTRLSDFLLWQSAYAVLRFTETEWPATSFWSMLMCILHYQRHIDAVLAAEQLVVGDGHVDDQNNAIPDGKSQQRKATVLQWDQINKFRHSVHRSSSLQSVKQ